MLSLKSTTHLFVVFAVVIICATTLSSLILVAAEQEQQQQNDQVNTWLLFSIDKNSKIDLVGARPLQGGSPSPCINKNPGPTSKKIIVTYQRLISMPNPELHQEGQEELCHVVVHDPRVMYHDRPHPEHGESHFHGGRIREDESHFAIVVHSTVEEIESIDFSVPPASSSSSSSGGKQEIQAMKNFAHETQRHAVTQSHFRNAETLASAIEAGNVDTATHQMVGPLENQRNMVFVSSGYTSSQQSKFNNDVQSLLTFLQQSATGLSSMPYRRYFSMFNFFSVFHPSRESGASHPSPAGVGSTSDNILDCSYGSTSERTLACNRPRVLVLSSYAPPDPTTSLTIVLVNDNTFGGSGAPNICSVYTGDRMNVVFIHEVGHSFAGLSDEYSYFTSEANDIELTNCAYSATRNVPWERWIDANVTQDPVRICTYINYYKPTNGECLMYSDQPELCPVCKEGTTLTIYGFNGSLGGSNNGLNIAAPRFPSEHDTIVVRMNETAKLKINNKIDTHTDDSGTFSIKWYSPAGTSSTPIANNVSTIAVGYTGASTPSGASAIYHHAAPGEYLIHVVIQDHTDLLLPDRLGNLSTNTSSKKSFKQHHTFNVKVIATADITTSCTTRTDSDSETYCGICESGYESECALNVTARPLAAISDVGGEIPGLQGWLIGIGCAFVGIGAIAFFFAWKTMEQYADEHVGEILPLSDELAALRIAVMVFQVCLLLCSTFVVMYAAYMFLVLSIFGRTMVLGIMITTCFVWFFSFIGFTGAYFNNRQVIFASFIASIFLLVLTLIFTGLLWNTTNNLNSPDVFLELRENWRSAVEHDTSAACHMQGYLYCSGFDSSCFTAIGATMDCPRYCEVANQIAFPCFPKIQNFVKIHFNRAAIGGILNACFLFVSMLLAIVLGCGMKLNKTRITRQRYKRAQEGHGTLSENEISMLRKEFNKVATEKNGQISREDFASFYTKTMGIDMAPEELNEYFDALDADGSGTLNFEEFVKIYLPAPEDEMDRLGVIEDDYLNGSGSRFVGPGSFGDHGTESMADIARRARQAVDSEKRGGGGGGGRDSASVTPIDPAMFAMHHDNTSTEMTPANSEQQQHQPPQHITQSGSVQFVGHDDDAAAASSSRRKSGDRNRLRRVSFGGEDDEGNLVVGSSAAEQHEDVIQQQQPVGKTSPSPMGHGEGTLKEYVHELVPLGSGNLGGSPDQPQEQNQAQQQEPQQNVEVVSGSDSIVRPDDTEIAAHMVHEEELGGDQ